MSRKFGVDRVSFNNDDTGKKMNTSFEITDHIGIFDGFYSEDFCKTMIDYFEYRYQYAKQNLTLDRSDIFRKDSSVLFATPPEYFQQNEILHMGEESLQIHGLFSEIFWNQIYPKYAENYIGLTSSARHSMGILKVQRTKPKEGYHAFHYESGQTNHLNRFIFIILYLNTIEDGGETEFLHQSTRVKPKIGRMIVSPSGFTHVHRGNPPLKDTKYIATTWLELHD